MTPWWLEQVSQRTARSLAALRPVQERTARSCAAIERWLRRQGRI